MGELCAVTPMLSVIVPSGGGPAPLGTVPTGLLAFRYRLRVLIAVSVAAG
jgi:energy-coupling factor transport system ATP-binding protein